MGRFQTTNWSLVLAACDRDELLSVFPDGDRRVGAEVLDARVASRRPVTCEATSET